jgi:hypothetical protein
MTPLTHAAVGAVLCQQLGRIRWARWAWLLAFPLAFLSHYALDAIPHFEAFVAPSVPKESFLLIAAVGLAGMAIALLLMRGNREAGRLWLVISLWIAVGPYSFSWLRVLTAALGLAYLGWASRRLRSVACLAASILSISPDLAPAGFERLASLHYLFHYRTDLALRLFRAYSESPFPEGWKAQLHNPYFLLGYGLELLIEGGIFLTAIYLFSRERLVTENRAGAEITESLAVSAKTGSPVH